MRRTIYKRQQGGEKVINVCRRIQTGHNRFVQPVQRISPGQIMRICSLLGALVHARKDEIKQLAKRGEQEGGLMAGGLEKKCVTNVRITSENNTAGVSRRGERLILMRITNPRHTPLLTSALAVCVCARVYLSVSVVGI